VSIIEDEREIREGLKVLVSGTPGYSVVGAWRSMEEALHKITQKVPDVVLVDIGLPRMTG
jgi:YesN/AraC family two-component response regulator